MIYANEVTLEKCAEAPVMLFRACLVAMSVLSIAVLFIFIGTVAARVPRWLSS